MKTRFTMDVTPTVRQRIERLQELHDGASVAEVARRSFASLELIKQLEAENAEIVARWPDGREAALKFL